MSQTTRATQFLKQQGIAFTLHSYDYDPHADSIGLAAAAALGAPPGRVLKTLMVLADGKPACAVIPSDCELSMKKLAAALGCKAATMMKPDEAERVTGYHVGGISPFGQKKRLTVVLEQAALAHAEVYLNSGQRGLQAQIAPGDIVRALNAITAAITA
ncbi:MAG: Cys-tRNA(Pro) deacylase [Rhizomicrobium sp.]|nr:Cys-tRNA(Pro) deacylase [Rhizomicrobium sp.]